MEKINTPRIFVLSLMFYWNGFVANTIITVLQTAFFSSYRAAPRATMSFYDLTGRFPEWVMTHTFPLPPRSLSLFSLSLWVGSTRSTPQLGPSVVLLKPNPKCMALWLGVQMNPGVDLVSQGFGECVVNVWESFTPVMFGIYRGSLLRWQNIFRATFSLMLGLYVWSLKVWTVTDRQVLRLQKVSWKLAKVVQFGLHDKLQPNYWLECCDIWLNHFSTVSFIKFKAKLSAFFQQTV